MSKSKKRIEVLQPIVKSTEDNVTFEKLIDVPFEDMVVPIPENYDLFLTQFYGNYMQKPSDEEIAYKSHLLKAYWKK